MKYHKIIRLITIFILLACQKATAEEIEINHADFLEANKQQILIRGNVKIKYKGAIIEAPEGTITTNDKGEQDKAVFIGRTKLKLNDRRLEADKITVLIKDKTIYAEGNTISQLKDKKNNLITIACDYQELHWSGEDAKVRGNIKTIYQDTKVNSDEGIIIYKNKKPEQAIFSSNEGLAHLEQPSNTTKAKEFVFDIVTHNVEAFNNVTSLIWTNTDKDRREQDPVHVTADEVYIDNSTGTVVAKSNKNKVKLDYQETRGESNETTMLRNKETGNPEKIIFKGNANVNQEDKQLTSEEIVFNFSDKKLISNTTTNIRPKTVIFKK